MVGGEKGGGERERIAKMIEEKEKQIQKDTEELQLLRWMYCTGYTDRDYAKKMWDYYSDFEEAAKKYGKKRWEEIVDIDWELQQKK
jgi:hypothetical protein